MASERLGRIVPLHRGEYQDDRIYELNDIVSFHGSTFWHHAHEPSRHVPPMDRRFWYVVNDMREAEKLIRKAHEDAKKAEMSAEVAQIAATTAAGVEDRVKGDAKMAHDAAKKVMESISDVEADVNAVKEATDIANKAAKTASDAADSAAEDAVAAKKALEGMTYVTFDMEVNGHVVLRNGEVSGSTEFKIDPDTGRMEVTY